MSHQATISSELTIEQWTERAKEHEKLITPYTEAFLQRRELGISHPIHDFLFTYYRCSPKKLKQWIPSLEQTLQIAPKILDQYPWLSGEAFFINEHSLSLNKKRLNEGVYGLMRFVAELSHRILERTPRFSCLGLHEWAMVYKLPPKARRHYSQPLRLSCEEIESFVESQKISCSHYDAYRFFTKEALSLNLLKPRLDTRLEMEQGGCVHANMDLYKWSTKLWPWIGSDFLLKTFFLALEGRELDMKASPYDFKNLGYSPICIETETGKKTYQQEQQNLTKKATSLREELHAFCVRFISD